VNAIIYKTPEHGTQSYLLLQDWPFIIMHVLVIVPVCCKRKQLVFIVRKFYEIFTHLYGLSGFYNRKSSSFSCLHALWSLKAF